MNHYRVLVLIGSLLSIQAKCVRYLPKATSETVGWGLSPPHQIMLQSDSVMPVGISTTTELLA